MNCQFPEMEFVTTTRGGRTLIHEGYKHVLNRQGHDERIFWKFAKSHCCSGALTTINDEIVSIRASEHKHPPNHAEMIACKTIKSMKQTVKVGWLGIPSFSLECVLHVHQLALVKKVHSNVYNVLMCFSKNKLIQK